MHASEVAGKDFRNNLSSCVSHLSFRFFLDDLDAQMKPSTTSYGSEHCECESLNADDAISEREYKEDS